MVRSAEEDAMLYGHIVEEVGRQLRLVLPHAEGREGGVLSVFNPAWLPETTPVLTFVCGFVSSEKRAEKVRFSLEKGVRLLQNPEHLSSWETRDVARERFGGAIRAGGHILSFSGLPEICDETLLVLTARACRWLQNSDELYYIFSVSNNTLAPRLLG